MGAEAGLLERYRALVLATSKASAEEDEAPGWG
jgi:hypothetical protein